MKSNKELINEVFTEEIPDEIYQKIKKVLDLLRAEYERK